MRDNSNIMSSDERIDIILSEIKAMRSDFAEVKDEMKAMSAKLDGNTIEMNERFAVVDERFMKSEAIMETTSQRINLVEKSVNDTLTSIMDDVSADIKTQIGEARSEFHDVITTTNDRVRMISDKIDKQLDDMKTITNIRMLESDTKVDNLTKSVATVTSKLDTYILREMPAEVRALTRPAMDNLYLDMDRVKASVANIEATVNAIDTKHMVTPDHMHVYFKALQAEIVEVKASQLAANTVADRSDNRIASNAAPDVNVRSDRRERPVQSRSIHEISPVEWIRDPTTLTMGEETMAFMRENADSSISKGKNRAKKKKAKSKKKHKEAEDDDPSDSDPSSSSSSSSSESSDTSTSSDSSDRDRRKSKKKGKAKSLLDPEKFGSGNRRASIIGDDDMREPVGAGYFRDRGSAYLCIQPPPDTKELYLDKIRIDSVLAFCKKFNSESARHVGGLKVGNYISDHARSQLRQVAIKHKLPGQEGIICSGVQTISNAEVFALLSTMVAPKNLEAMQYELYQTCFPRTTFDYSDAQSTVNNISEFKNDVLIYIDRFEDKLRLLGYSRKAKKFLPKRLFKKGGSAANPGLADYFIYGLPRPEFGWNIWGSVDDDKKEACTQWEVFLKLYMKAIEKIEKRERQKKINRSIAIGVCANTTLFSRCRYRRCK